MPNKHTTDGNYRYEYQGKFAEKDSEINQNFFERRLYDARLGRWLKTDEILRSYESPYLGMGNNLKYGDPDGRDIIVLIDSKAVGGLGHAAVLIGNDKDGWRYLSMNGTGEGSSAWADSKNADLGNISEDNGFRNDFRGTGLNADEVMKLVNTSNKNETHEYDKFIRIKTSPEEDKVAYASAKRQASKGKYIVIGQSCIDVPQEAIEGAMRIRTGRNSFFNFERMVYALTEPTPVLWYSEAAALPTINLDLKYLYRVPMFQFTKGNINNYKEVSSSPRYF